MGHVTKIWKYYWHAFGSPYTRIRISTFEAPFMVKTSYLCHHCSVTKEHDKKQLSPSFLTSHINMATTTKTTNLGPLTTTFSAPSHCLSQTFRYTRSDIKCGNEGCGWLHLGNTSDSRCLPSGYHALTGTEFFYSPGVCPKSYTAACSNVFTSGSELQTIATCCPKCEIDSFVFVFPFWVALY